MGSWDEADDLQSVPTNNNRGLIERLRRKIESTDRERAAQELAHAQSSDWHSPPSMRVARLEGQIVAFKWMLEELQKCV